MAEQKFKAVAELFLDTKDAANDAKQFVKDVKKQLMDLETAADKVTVFKDFVDYIAQIDKNLAALKAKNADAFSHMFDGIDTNARQMLESLFGTSGKQLGQIDALRERLATLTPKSSIKDVRQFATEINELYTALGKTPPLNLDEFSNTRTTKKHIEDITNTVENFATVWGDVNTKLAKGFTFGGTGGGGFGDNITEDTQELINKLKQQKEEYEEILNTFDKHGKISITMPKKSNDQIEYLKTLKDAFISANKEKSNLEASGKTNGDEYLVAVANYTKASAQLKSAFEHDDLTSGAINWINKNGLDYLEQASNALQDVFNRHKDMVSEIKKLYSGKIGGLDNEILSIMNTKDSPENIIAPYDELKAKLQEYYDLKQKLANLDKNSDEYNNISNLQLKIQDEIQTIKALNQDEENSLYDVFDRIDSNEIQIQDAILEFANILGVKIPEAADIAKNKFDSLASSIKEVFTSSSQLEIDTRNGKATGKELMNLFDTNGTVSTVQGIDYQVDTDALVQQVVANLNKNIIMSLHNHANGDMNFSPSDINSFAKLYYGQGVKINGIIADGIIQTIDFSDISQEIAIKIAENYQEGIKHLFDAENIAQFASFENGNIVPTDLLKQIQSNNYAAYQEIINQLQEAEMIVLRQAFETNGAEFTLKSFDVNNIDELAKYLSNVQQNSKAAIEPVEKLKNLIIALHPETDLGQFTDIFEKFKSGAIDGSKALNQILNFKTVAADAETSTISIDQASTKVKEFLALADEIHNKSFSDTWDATDNVEVGKYTERLNVAKAALDALGDQGQLTAEQLEQVRNAFDVANEDLKEKTKTYDSYYTSGEYSYTYFAEYETEKDRADQLETENKSLREQLNKQQQQQNVEQNIFGDTIQDLDQLESLRSKVIEVKNAVNAKNKAFNDEGIIVGQVVGKEISALKHLQDLLNDIQDAISQINLADINVKSDNLESIANTIDNANTSTENIHYVTDPQGKPMYMYRGIHDTYGGLVSNRYHGGTFSTNDLEVAKSYAGEFGKVEKVLLSMKNPFEINGNGALWNHIEYIGDKSDETSQKLYELNDAISANNKLLEEAQKMPISDYEERAIKMGFMLPDDTQRAKDISYYTQELAKLKAEKEAIFADSNNPYGIKNTNEIVKLAKTSGYDGVIFKDIIDSANKNIQQASTVMVTFTQDQIHYVETIGATFESAINSFKSEYGELTKYVNLSADEINNAIVDIRNLRQKVNSGEITNDEYESLLSKNILADGISKITDIKHIDADFVESALNGNDSLSAINAGSLVKIIDEFISSMRERLQKIAKTFDMEDVPFDKLIETNPNNDARTNVPDQNKVNSSGGYALENTLQSTNSILGQILASIGNNESLAQLVEPLNTAVTELKNVANGIIEHQKAQQTDRTAASTRIANNYGQLSSIAGNAVNGIGENFQIENMKALADNIVRVRGAVQNANGVWKGFVIDINESNNAVIRAVDEQSEFAKSLNETANAAKNAGEETKAQESPANDGLAKKIYEQTNALNEYRNGLKNVGYISDELNTKINELGKSLKLVTSADDLESWKSDFQTVKKEVSIAAKLFENQKLQASAKIKGSANAQIKTLNFKDTDTNLAPDQQKILDLQAKLNNELAEYELRIQNSLDANLDAANQTKAALDKEIAAYKERNNIVNASGNANKQAPGATTVGRATNKYKSLSDIANSDEFKQSSVIQQMLASYTAAYQKLVNIQSKFKVGEKLTDGQQKEFDDARIACNNYAKELEKVFNASQKLKDKSSVHSVLGGDFVDNDSGRQTALKQFIEDTYGANATIVEFKDNFNKLIYTVDNGDGTFSQMTAEINASRTAIDATIGSTKEATSAFGQFWNELKGKFKSIGAYLTASFSIQEVWQQIRQGVNYVREIDSALTELKKVTDETDQTYQKFLQTASKTASVIGSNVADFTNATADFARLGYNLEQASSLAKAASVYKNVGDGIDDVATASESIISTMKAFGIEAEDAMGIVDRFNEVGNNFAISSTGIGEAMQRSASALYEAGNTIDESIGLITAANSVIQNPEQVGTALKTLALRLRGTKTELEEAGEDVDGMAESTSQLQAKLKALTHGKVDIMIDADTFKNTTEILREMSQAWEDMTDIERASALELMGGKRQANILSSIIKNFDTVDQVIQTSSDSSGSALAENEKYLDSIQGKIDQFTNSLQTMWMNFIDSDALKFIIDLGRAIIQLVDTFGLIPSAAGIFTAYKSAAKELKQIFNDTSVSTKELKNNLNEYITQQMASAQASEVETAAVEANTAAKQTEEATTQAVTVAKQAEEMASVNTATSDQLEGQMSLFDAEANNMEEISSEGVSQAKQQEAINVNAAKQADIEETASSEANASANAKQAAASAGASSGSGIWSKIGSSVMAIGKAGLKGLAVMAALKVATYALGKAWDWLDKEVIHRAENIKQKVEELQKTFEDTKKTLDDNLTTLTTSSDTSVYETLQDEFNILTKGVDQFGNNISLTADQYERYKQICDKIVGVNPRLASGHESVTEAIGNNADALSQLIELQKIEARQNAFEYVKDDNLKTITEDAINNYNEAKSAVLDAELELENNLSTLTYNIIQPIDSWFSQVDEAPEELQDIYDEFVEKFYTDGIFDFNKVADPVELTTYLKKFNDIGKNTIGENFAIFDASWIDSVSLEDSFNELEQAQKNLEQYKDGIIDTLKQIPLSMKEYEDLSDPDKSFISKWIENNDLFKIDDNTTQEDILKYKAQIKELIRGLANDDYTTELDGKTITASDIIDSILNLDSTNVDWEKYKAQADELLALLFNALNITDESEKNAIKVSLGINFEIEDEDGNTKEQKLIDDIVRVTGNAQDEVQQWLKQQPASVVNAMMEVDWSAKAGMTYDEMIAEAKSTAPDIDSVISVKTYSSLTEEIEKYNDILSQTSEIVTDNTEVTQEYKDSLIELGISEEDLADCFDDTNGLIVKNVSRLKQLVSTAKTSISTQTTLARAQARLKYKELYKQLASLTNGQLKNAQANKTQINLLYQEMSAVQKMISRYSLLEQQLAEVTKTYTEFEEAQTVDSDNDYMSKTEEMLVAAIQAYQTGELGTETAKVAIPALVPEFVLNNPDLKTVDEQAEAAHKYIMETLNKYFKLTFDEDTGEIESAEMLMGNVRKFIEDGLNGETKTGMKIFEGEDWMHFEWSKEFLAGLEGADDKLQYFADQWGITKEVALAAIQEINNHDIEWLSGDYGSLFDQIVPETLDSKLQTTTARMAELNVQLANGKITQQEYEAAMGGLNTQLASGAITQDQYNAKIGELNKQLADGAITQEEYTRQVSGLNGQLVEQQTAAVDACNSFIDINNKMDESQKKLEEYQKQLSSGTDLEGNKLTSEQIEEINKQYTQELQNYEGYLKQKKDLENKYGPMTEYTVSIALEKQGVDIDNIEGELAKTKNDINSSIEKLNSSLNGIEVSINDDGEIEYKITDKTEPYQLDALKKLGALNEDGTVNISLLYGGLTDEQKAEVDKLSSLEEKQNLINYYLSMDGVNTVQTAIDNLTTTLNNIYNLLATSPTFSANVSQETKTTLDGLLSKVSSWVGDHWANFKATVSSIFGGGKSGDQESNGTVHANGTAHATGSFGLPSNEKDALVGEIGPELVWNMAR